MKKIAIIKDGIVQNIAIWDESSDWEPSADILVDVTGMFVGPGFSWDGENFSAPVEPVEEGEE